MGNAKNESLRQNLENSLPLFLEKKVRVYRRQDTPPKIKPEIWKNFFSPEIPLSNLLSSIWQNFTVYSQEYTDSIIESTTELLLVTDFHTSKVMGMVYLLSDQTQKSFYPWFGHLPAAELDFEEFRIRAGFDLPDSLKAFLGIHNGFYLEGIPGSGINSTKSIFPLIEYGNPSYKDYWSICGDGAGNERCLKFDQAKIANDFLTYDWDHETTLFSDPKNFYTFLVNMIK